MTLLFDTREPNPHPWAAHLPEGWHIEHGTLETGDIALARIPEGVVIERKTPSDLAGCIGASRERFERELRRGRYVGRFLIVVEGTLADVQRTARGIHPNSISGTLASWAVRFCPIIFAGSTAGAADFAFRALASQVRDIQRAAQSVSSELSAIAPPREEKPATMPHSVKTRHPSVTTRHRLNQFMNASNPSNQNTTSKKKPSSWAKVGIQEIKRVRVDAFVGANSHFSDRKLARLLGVSHTFVAKRRKKIPKILQYN